MGRKGRFCGGVGVGVFTVVGARRYQGAGFEASGLGDCGYGWSVVR